MTRSGLSGVMASGERSEEREAKERGTDRTEESRQLPQGKEGEEGSDTPLLTKENFFYIMRERLCHGAEEKNEVTGR